jgi:pyridoxal 5'-phosphate synthase pdxT subunit
MKIGVLAVQGDFAAHASMLKQIEVEAVEVRTASHLGDLDGLIIPGGESTTMLKLLSEGGMLDPLREFAKSGKPVLGTCAGAILVASRVLNPSQESLGLIDITVERNGYGRQVDSFIGTVESKIGDPNLEAVFIRAPRIRETGPEVEILASASSEPVLVRQRNIFAATFHPELTGDQRIHKLLVSAAS